MKIFIKLLATVTSALLISQCAPMGSGGSLYGGPGYLSGFQVPGAQPGALPGAPPRPQGYWDDSGVTGPARIRISLADQRAYFYKGETLVGVSPISTGTDGHGTPRGSYRVTEKDIDHASSLYGIIKDRATGQTVNPDADTRIHKAGPGQVFELAPMKYFLRFNGAVGMHAGFLPGYPASHGCVRLDEGMAKIFYNNASVGTPVTVE